MGSGVGMAVVFEEKVKNLSLLTTTDVEGGVAPLRGTVGDHANVPPFYWRQGVSPKRLKNQRCSQVVLRKTDGLYSCVVDGVTQLVPGDRPVGLPSGVPTEVELLDYYGIPVTTTIRSQSGAENNVEWETVTGFKEETSEQSVLGPVMVAVVVEEGQSIPDEVVVRTWQHTVVGGCKLERAIVAQTKMKPSELAESTKVDWLALPFPATFIQQPYIELFDTTLEDRAIVNRTGGAIMSIASYVITAFFTTSSTGFTATYLGSWWMLWRRGQIGEGVGDDRLRSGLFLGAVSALAMYAATFLGFTGFAAMLNLLTVKEIWSVITQPDEEGNANFVPRQPLAAAELGVAETMRQADFNALRAASWAKIVTNIPSLFGWTESTPKTRVRYTVPEISETLERIATASGGGTQSLSGKKDHRETVLINFMARAPRLGWLAWLIQTFKSIPEGGFFNLFRRRSDEERRQQLKKLQEEAEKTSETGVLVSGLELSTLQQHRVWMEYEVVVNDIDVSRVPIAVTVKASERCGLRAGWHACGMSDDVDKLTRQVALFPFRLWSGVATEASTAYFFGFSSRLWKVLKNFGDRATWGKLLRLVDARRDQVATGIQKLSVHLSTTQGPLYRLRAEVEKKKPQRKGKRLPRTPPIRVLPHRASVTFSIPSFTEPEGSGLEVVPAGNIGVRMATAIASTVQSASSSVSRNRLALRPVVEDWESISTTRLVGFFFVNTSGVIRAGQQFVATVQVPIANPYEALEGRELLQPLDGRIMAFSPVQTVPPFEVLDAQRRQRQTTEVKEGQRLMRMEISKEEAAAELALADELLSRLVNRERHLPTSRHHRDGSVVDGAQIHTRDCVNYVLDVLKVAARNNCVVHRNDTMFFCFKGGRGAWVLLRAAQMWERRSYHIGRHVSHPDGASLAVKLATFPRQAEEELADLAAAYRKAVNYPPEKMAKVQVTALQHMLGVPRRTELNSRPLDVKIAESFASFDRVKEMCDQMGHTAVGRHLSLVATVAMRPTLLCLRGAFTLNAPQDLEARQFFIENVLNSTRRVPKPTFGEPPRVVYTARLRGHRRESMELGRDDDRRREVYQGYRTYAVPYSHWVGDIVFPQSNRTIESIPVWTSLLREVIETMVNDMSDSDVEATIDEFKEPFLIHVRINDTTGVTEARARFAQCHRHTIDEEMYLESPLAERLAELTQYVDGLGTEAPGDAAAGDAAAGDAAAGEPANAMGAESDSDDDTAATGTGSVPRLRVARQKHDLPRMRQHVATNTGVNQGPPPVPINLNMSTPAHLLDAGNGFPELTAAFAGANVTATYDEQGTNTLAAAATGAWSYGGEPPPRTYDTQTSFQLGGAAGPVPDANACYSGIEHRGAPESPYELMTSIPSLNMSNADGVSPPPVSSWLRPDPRASNTSPWINTPLGQPRPLPTIAEDPPASPARAIAQTMEWESPGLPRVPAASNVSFLRPPSVPPAPIKPELAPSPSPGSSSSPATVAGGGFFSSRYWWSTSPTPPAAPAPSAGPGRARPTPVPPAPAPSPVPGRARPTPVPPAPAPSVPGSSPAEPPSSTTPPTTPGSTIPEPPPSPVPTPSPPAPVPTPSSPPPGSSPAGPTPAPSTPASSDPGRERPAPSPAAPAPSPGPEIPRPTPVPPAPAPSVPPSSPEAASGSGPTEPSANAGSGTDEGFSWGYLFGLMLSVMAVKYVNGVPSALMTPLTGAPFRVVTTRLSDAEARRRENEREKRREQGESEEDEEVVTPPQYEEPTEIKNLLQAVESLVVYGGSGKLTHRAGVIIWNCERVVQSVLLMDASVQSIAVYYPKGVRAGKAVARKDDLETLRKRLQHLMRLAVSEHFRRLKAQLGLQGWVLYVWDRITIRRVRDHIKRWLQRARTAVAASQPRPELDPLDPFRARVDDNEESFVILPEDDHASPFSMTSQSTGVTIGDIDRLPVGQLPRYNFDDPVDNSNDSIVSYCRNLDEWIDEFAKLGARIPAGNPQEARVRRLLGIHDSTNAMMALARAEEPHTMNIQRRNVREAGRINETNRQMFAASVALAGAILSCIISPAPRLVLRDRRDNDDDPDPSFADIGPIPTRATIKAYCDEWFQTRKRLKQETGRSIKEAYDQLLQDAGIGDTPEVERLDADGNQPPAMETVLAETPGDMLPTTTRADDTQQHAVLANDVRDILQPLKTACTNYEGALTLAELALVCSAW